jgi:hypothetical protein
MPSRASPSPSHRPKTASVAGPQVARPVETGAGALTGHLKRLNGTPSRVDLTATI